MTPSANNSPFVLRIRYTREGGKQQVKIFFRAARASSFLDKLEAGSPGLAALTQVSIERAQLGQWEPVEM